MTTYEGQGPRRLKRSNTSNRRKSSSQTDSSNNLVGTAGSLIFDAAGGSSIWLKVKIAAFLIVILIIVSIILGYLLPNADKWPNCKKIEGSNYYEYDCGSNTKTCTNVV